jgi:hypothetical protein
MVGENESREFCGWQGRMPREKVKFALVMNLF